TPAFVHGGPFANIAHGTNTVIADEMGRSLADYTVTEAGFAADLGLEKFADIVARRGLVPDAVVLVATVRALKYHGLDMWPADYDRLAEPDVEAVREGLANLEHHMDVIRSFGLPFVVAVNRFPDDTDAEVGAVVDALESRGVRVAVSEMHARGSEGGRGLADHVVDLVERESSDFAPLYDLEASLREKIETVGREVYGAAEVTFTDDAAADLERLAADGMDGLPVCISKTQHSITDDSAVKGAPRDWTLTVRRLYPSAGAGFVVALTGDVLTMPGLPAEPAAEDMDVDADGTVSGLF
ncbi:MAG: formate--tetrahydrofolate ligase, partial [Halanaeroarchaeum sp.]